MKMQNKGAIGEDWADVRKELLSAQEIAESDIRVALIGEMIKIRNEQEISQKKLEEISGVKQPIIARMERGTTDPRLSTVIKLLAAMDMTLRVVPISKK